MTPDLSVLIAAYRLRDMVPAAVASVLERAGGCAVEIVIASDDGTDYREVLPPDPRLVFAPVGPVGSGAHAARNRALGLARGRFVLMLDGDDALEGAGDGIRRALDQAAGSGAVILPSLVRLSDGAPLRLVPPEGTTRFGFDGWASAFSSLHLIARREGLCPFEPFRLIDDVIHDLRALAAIGGEAPVATALRYRYQLRAGQSTDTAGNVFDAEYAAALARIAADGFGFGAHAADAARVLRRWRAMNRLVGGTAGRPLLGEYHRSVENYLQGLWPSGRRNPKPVDARAGT